MRTQRLSIPSISTNAPELAPKVLIPRIQKLDLINSNEKTAFSFEILPPLKGTGIEKLYETIAITAVKLSEKEIKDLEKNLSIKYNKNVTLNNIVDETILGGVLVKLGNEEIDGTVRTRLSKMKNQLSQVIS